MAREDHAPQEMAKLARCCANHARIASRKEAAEVLWKMARKYQKKAAELDGGELPDIGEPPPQFGLWAGL
jgi:hypothetical protein